MVHSIEESSPVLAEAGVVRNIAPRLIHQYFNICMWFCMQKVKKFVYLYGFDLNFQVMIMVESRRKKFFYFLRTLVIYYEVVLKNT